MKASLLFALFCVAAVAVTTISATNIEDVPELKNVEAAGNADGVQPLYFCDYPQNYHCQKDCKKQGYNTGYCNDYQKCICTNADRPKNVEAAENVDGVQPLLSCQAGGDWLCDKSCKLQGHKTGKCTKKNICKCKN